MKTYHKILTTIIQAQAECGNAETLLTENLETLKQIEESLDEQGKLIDEFANHWIFE